MRHRSTVGSLLLGTVLIAGSLAGCGGGSDAAAGPSTSAGAADVPAAAAFADPEKTYTIMIAKAWNRAAAPARGIEAWAVAPPKGGFAANVNVLTQDAPGLDLAGYLDASLANMGTAKVVKHETVSQGGRQLGVLEYTQTLPAGGKDRPLHFLATFDVADGHAVVATLTTEEPAFAGLRPTVEPFLRTLRAT
jgi:hypothetical protein